MKLSDIFNFFRDLATFKLSYFVNVTNSSISLGPFFDYKWVPECLGWRFTIKPDGGSVATIGCTSFGLSKEDKTQTFEGGIDYLVPCFFQQIGVEKVQYLGEAWGNSIHKYLEKYPIDWDTPSGGDSSMDAKTVEQWVLFGDPSLRIGGYNVLQIKK